MQEEGNKEALKEKSITGMLIRKMRVYGNAKLKPQKGKKKQWRRQHSNNKQRDNIKKTVTYMVDTNQYQ